MNISKVFNYTDTLVKNLILPLRSNIRLAILQK